MFTSEPLAIAHSDTVPFRILLYYTVITQPMSSYIDSAIQTSPAYMDTVLLDMQKVFDSLHGSSISNKDKGLMRSQKHSQMVAKFLQGQSKVDQRDCKSYL